MKCNQHFRFTRIQIDQYKIQRVPFLNGRYHFEYHCWEDHESSDAQAWYRSHQIVTIIGVADCDPVAFTTFKERGEAGHQILYRARFKDGFETTVFEDELLVSKKDFERPDPPYARPPNSNRLED